MTMIITTSLQAKRAQILTLTGLTGMRTTAAVPTYCVLRVEDVRGRRVVDDDDSAELPAQSAEVFDVVSSVENAGFPEEPGAEHPPLVQQVCHGIGILIGDGTLGERRATALRYRVRRREAHLG